MATRTLTCDASGGRGLREGAHVAGVVGGHGDAGAAREGAETLDLRRRDHHGGHEQVGDSGGGEHLGLADGGRADAADRSPGCELHVRDGGAAVGLDAWAQPDGAVPEGGVHRLDVPVQRFEVDDQRRGIEVLYMGAYRLEYGALHAWYGSFLLVGPA